MIFTETRLTGAFIVDLERREDDRGFFARAYCEREFAEHGLSPRVSQVNVGFSRRRGTMRGMHFQYPPAGET
jgi:dTDP-4-dehydrorhamnose 3,5-epimerase